MSVSTVHADRFAGRTVVVTGAAQGIGLAVARRLAAESALLTLVDRSELVHEAAAELGAYSLTADLEAYAGAEEAIAAALERHGRIDVLVNNVVGAINFKPFTEFSAQEIEAEITRSLLTTLWSCRAVLPTMTRQGHGVIVNVSSAATRGIHRIPYSAAKGGINALTASLALECADAGVRVVATAPGTCRRRRRSPRNRTASRPPPCGTPSSATWRSPADGPRRPRPS